MEPTFANDTVAPVSDDDFPIRGGMTLRQHFAALAIGGLLANGENEFVAETPERIAKRAVRCADALIAALNAPPPND